MKISDFKAAQVAQAYGLQNVASSTKKKEGVQRSDETTLSQEAQELLKARRAVQDSPDVRADVVAELQRQVQAGTYQVDDRSLARRLMDALNLTNQ